jgi:DNA-binding NtrC family response regulator
LKRTILYLDDDAACLQIFLDFIGPDYDVQTARTLAEARARLAERPAEIVISDQSMPEVDGTEFLLEVAEKYPASCRVLLTGTVTVGGVMHQLGTGVVQLFLTKPWTEREMRAVLERADVYLEASQGAFHGN